MNRIKKFWIAFLAMLPFGAGAVAPIVVGGITGGVVLAGFSIYRSAVPVNMADAYSFFSSCWTCHLFSDIMATMSNILPGVYHAIGGVIVPFAVVLSAIWFAWRIINGFINNKIDNPWNLTSAFGTHLIKLAFVSALVVAPLPRLVSEIAIQPIFNIGLSVNRLVTDNESFDSCVVATALAETASVDSASANAGAFSPNLRNNLACELAGVHQMTGLGMTVGWTMLSMAFNDEYMHKLMWNVPIFPNVPIFFCGLLVLVLFFWALLPIPVYFLEIFIKLSLDLIMLPLMLLSWLFQDKAKDWKITLPSAAKSIQQIINDVISGTVGIALVGVFVTFAIMFLDAVFGDWAGVSRLAAALVQNDSKILMDGLMLRDDSLITVVLMGIFMAMFMTMIPALVKTLFNIQISQDFYDTTKKNMDTMWQGLKKWYSAMKK